MSHLGNIVNGNEAPLRNNMAKYSNCVMMALSCMELTTAATVRPSERKAIKPNDAKSSTEKIFVGNTMP